MLLILPAAVGPPPGGLSGVTLCFIMDTGLFLFSSFYLLLILGMEGVGRASIRWDGVQMPLTSQGGFEDRPSQLGEGQLSAANDLHLAFNGPSRYTKKDPEVWRLRGCGVGP